jgi:hypothetical protein
VTTLLVSLVLPLWVRTQELVPAPPPHTGIFCPMTCWSLFWIPTGCAFCPVCPPPPPCSMSSTVLSLLYPALYPPIYSVISCPLCVLYPTSCHILRSLSSYLTALCLFYFLNYHLICLSLLFSGPIHPVLQYVPHLSPLSVLKSMYSVLCSTLVCVTVFCFLPFSFESPAVFSVSSITLCPVIGILFSKALYPVFTVNLLSVPSAFCPVFSAPCPPLLFVQRFFFFFHSSLL